MMEIEVNASYGVIHFYICRFAFVWRAEVSVRQKKGDRGASGGECEVSGCER